MQLLNTIIKNHFAALMGIILLNLCSAVLGVYTISYINHAFIAETEIWAGLAKLSGLLAALLVTTLAAQWALTTLGHHFIWRKRSNLIQEMMNTPLPVLESKGNGELLALLGPDIRNITLAFVRLPELIQGVVLSVVTVLFLGYLSIPVLLIVVVWMAVMLYIGYCMVSRVYHDINRVRQFESELQDVFQVVINGKKELSLNAKRAGHFYATDYQTAAQAYKHHIIRADTYHLSAINWSNIMILGLIGIIFLVSQTLNWVSLATATTFSLTVLFLRTPLLQAIGAFPTLLTGELAFKKINGLLPASHASSSGAAVAQDIKPDWRVIQWRGLTWRYAGSRFQVGPLDVTLTRGETVFIIGANGSGKSTLSLLLTGLYPTDDGKVLVDGEPLADGAALKSRFSVVFTQPYLFKTLFIEPEADDRARADAWLEKLDMGGKVELKDHQFASIALSQGQKKRLALMLAMAEKRDILLLDEWAAEQDPQFRRYFYRELIPWFKQQGKTLIVISHDDDYFDVADRLLHMSHGQLNELTGDARRRASRDVISLLEDA